MRNKGLAELARGAAEERREELSMLCRPARRGAARRWWCARAESAEGERLRLQTTHADVVGNLEAEIAEARRRLAASESAQAQREVETQKGLRTALEEQKAALEAQAEAKATAAAARHQTELEASERRAAERAEQAHDARERATSLSMEVARLNKEYEAVETKLREAIAARAKAQAAKAAEEAAEEAASPPQTPAQGQAQAQAQGQGQPASAGGGGGSSSRRRRGVGAGGGGGGETARGTREDGDDEGQGGGVAWIQGR